MPTITKLKSQKNQGRVNVYLDGNFALGISLDKVVKLGLHKGQFLSDDQIEKIFFSGFFEKLYNKTLNFLSFRPRSEKEVKIYLRKNFGKIFKKNNPDLITDKILKKLKKRSLINDKKFACWWLEQRLTFKPKGKRMLEAELLQKGVSKDIIEETLASISTPQLTRLAKNILAKKIKSLQSFPYLKIREKLFRHLISRGFDFELAQKVIDETLEK